MKDSNMETITKRILNDIMFKTTKSPEEIINLFNTKKVDEDWSFAGNKPSDTGK